VSAADPTSGPTTSSDPSGTDKPTRSAGLLALIRNLIAFGKQIVASLSQGGSLSDLPHGPRFGTGDIALIVARITRGLRRAEALEARIARNAVRFDAEPKPRNAPAEPKSHPARPAVQRGDDEASLLAHLPSEEEIAAEVRRRPVGAVIADICRDLGITTGHPLWRDIHLAIMFNGGSLVRHVKDLTHRVLNGPLSGYPSVTVLTALTHLLTTPAPPVASTGPP
jgi:hypothetical protein